MAARFIDAIYCDDIRNEAGGKHSLMGVYGNALFAREYPLTLPRFCVAVRLVMPIEESLEGVRLVVLLEDQELASVELGTADHEEARRQVEEQERTLGGAVLLGEDPERINLINMHFMFSPLQVAQPSILRIRLQGLEDPPRAPALAFAQRSTQP